MSGAGPAATPAGAPGPGPLARALVARHARLAASAGGVLDHVDGLRERIVEHAAADRAAQVRDELVQIPLERLAEVTDRNLRLADLARAGYRTVGDVLDVRLKDLDAVPGVGPATARGVVAAARALGALLGADKAVRVEFDAASRTADPASTELLVLLHRYRRLAPLVSPHRSNLAGYAGSVTRDLPAARRAAGRLSLVFSASSTRRAARAALERLARWDPWLADTGLADVVDRLADACAQPDPPHRAVLDEFEARSAEFYTTLEELAPRAGQTEAASGRITADLALRVAEHPLDVSGLRVSLRGYQAFGARFVLNQGRALLGDEMGLGKTIQALAVMTHLAAQGEERFLVVCPASVLVGWLREIGARTDLVAHRLHGPDRDEALARWLTEGGVGVTTYEGLEHVPLPGAVPGGDVDGGGASPLAPVGALVPPPASGLGLLVVDEAHAVKNPRAQRSVLVARWAAATGRVLLMSGTPMENRLDEFLALVRLLDPAVAARVPRHLRLAGPDVFRRAVSPVYLRRNQEDVLVELPDLVRVDEWLPPTPASSRAYRDAVASGSFMRMRRAAYATPPADSPKLAKLLEIVDDAAENLHRVVVFSYFRDVLDTVAAAVAAGGLGRPFGPLTGDTPPDERQRLVDEFSAAPPGAVLVAQVKAGGVGLNIQAASVVVLCEPQVTPTMEAQAIARVHRMGQVRTVVAHRLLGTDDVDERLVELLEGKERVFAEYVRESALTDAAPGAVDVSEADLVRDVVAFEQARLGYGPVWDGLVAEGLLADPPRDAGAPPPQADR